jgi:hypothetical protein
MINLIFFLTKKNSPKTDKVWESKYLQVFKDLHGGVYRGGPDSPQGRECKSE